MIEIDEDRLPREPIRVFLYSDGLASIDGELQMSAFGAGALKSIAKKMIAIGYDGDQELDIHRGGESVQRVLLREAAQQSENEF